MRSGRTQSFAPSSEYNLQYWLCGRAVCVVTRDTWELTLLGDADQWHHVVLVHTIVAHTHGTSWPASRSQRSDPTRMFSGLDVYADSVSLVEPPNDPNFWKVLLPSRHYDVIPRCPLPDIHSSEKSYVNVQVRLDCTHESSVAESALRRSEIYMRVASICDLHFGNLSQEVEHYPEFVYLQIRDAVSNFRKVGPDLWINILLRSLHNFSTQVISPHVRDSKGAKSTVEIGCFFNCTRRCPPSDFLF